MKIADHKPVPPSHRQHATNLRAAATDAERKLWQALRYRLPKTSSHFRRQVPIGRYIVDFCSHGANLVIELDGNQHGTDEALRRDAVRTAFLESQGYRVLRFSNADVFRALDDVVDTIFAALERTPTPGPSPQGGG